MAHDLVQFQNRPYSLDERRENVNKNGGAGKLPETNSPDDGYGGYILLWQRGEKKTAMPKSFQIRNPPDDGYVG